MTPKKLTEERGTTHGSFEDNAIISQELKKVMKSVHNDYTPVQQEAIDMICLKLSRIASGHAGHIDHWRDVSSYAYLVVEQLEKTPGSTDSKVEYIRID